MPLSALALRVGAKSLSVWSAVSYIYLFPAWYAALWIWGYRSPATLGSDMFIIVCSSALYAVPLYGLGYLLSRKLLVRTRGVRP